MVSVVEPSTQGCYAVLRLRSLSLATLRMTKKGRLRVSAANLSLFVMVSVVEPSTQSCYAVLRLRSLSLATLRMTIPLAIARYAQDDKLWRSFGFAQDDN
jgi:hypothetical protein